MSTITTSDFQRIAISSIGALLVSAACVAATVSPVRAAEPNAPLTVADWQSQVSHQLDTTMREPALSPRETGVGTAMVAARFDANGNFSDANMVKSSGSSAIDRAALTTARTLAYPSFPAGLRGTPQTITLRLYYGVATNGRDAATQTQAFERSARKAQEHKDIQTAALPAG